MAIFPLGIKTFTAKRNLLDDVDASHINDIQSEITAIETVLGENPHTDDTGGKWKSLRDRLNSMGRGGHVPVFDFYNATPGTFNTDVRTKVAFPAPGAAKDTHGMFSASSAITPVDGWWLISIRAYYLYTGLRGQRYLDAATGGSTNAFVAASHSHFSPDEQGTGMWLQDTRLLRATKGTSISLYTNMQTYSLPNGKYGVAHASLQGHWVRGL
jgi:hypothetical protein